MHPRTLKRLRQCIAETRELRLATLKALRARHDSPPRVGDLYFFPDFDDDCRWAVLGIGAQDLLVAPVDLDPRRGPGDLEVSVRASCGAATVRCGEAVHRASDLFLSELRVGFLPQNLAHRAHHEVRRSAGKEDLMEPDDGEVTRLLKSWSNGDPEALDRLAPLIIEDLREHARKVLHGESPWATLQPTELVNEAMIRLLGCRSVSWKSRRHFFGTLVKIMRRILVDRARRRYASKRDAPMVDLDDGLFPSPLPDHQLIALDDALTDLENLDERQAEIVGQRFFFGLKMEEIAENLGVSLSTAQRDWRHARVWIKRYMDQDETS